MTFLSPVKRGFGDRKAPDKTYPNMTLCKRLLILYRIALRGGNPTPHQARQAACRIGQLKHADMHHFRVKHVDGVISYRKIRKAIQNA